MIANNSNRHVFSIIIAVALLTGCDSTEPTSTSGKAPIVQGAGMDASAGTGKPLQNQETNGSQQDVIALITSLDGVLKRDENGDVISVALVGMQAVSSAMRIFLVSQCFSTLHFSTSLDARS